MFKAAITLVALIQVASVYADVPAYGQCGGVNYTGETTCVSGYTCTYSNGKSYKRPHFYSQCVPGTAATTTTTTTKATTATSTTSSKASSTTTTSKATTTSTTSKTSTTTTSTTSKAATTTSTAAGGVRTTAPSGALVVSKSPSSGQYSSIQAAVNALSTTSTAAQAIFINPGVYTEQVIITARAAKLTIYGYTTNTGGYAGNTVNITWSYSQASGASKNEETATLQTRAAGFKLYNVNLLNTYGKGSQALALSAYADQQGYYGVGLYGYQDTLYSEIGNQVFYKCLIRGATDFIFGQHARTWIDHTDIQVVGAGYITANGRSDASDVSYYVINSCTVTAAPGVSLSSGSVYLGRPWSEYARVVFQKTSLSSIINSAGWVQWSSSTPRTANVLFGEYANTGTGASGTRASFATKLSSAITISDLLGSGYTSWVDTSYCTNGVC